ARLMTPDGKTQGIEIGDTWWQDVDTPAQLRYAEKSLTPSVRSSILVESASCRAGWPSGRIRGCTSRDKIYSGKTVRVNRWWCNPSGFWTTSSGSASTNSLSRIHPRKGSGCRRDI